jgi:hypothetical protein
MRVAVLGGAPAGHSRQLSGGEMKNPLDSLWGTVITGLVLTIVLYWIAKTVMGS